jgi:hypothetical protein
MREKRLERVFEDCLSACLEGRRTIADCLSLYPSLADRLEPVLRTALEVSDAFQEYSPPPHVAEQGLYRFQLAAETRARARAIAGRIESHPRVRMPWSIRQWGVLSGAVAAALVVAVMAGSMLAGSGGSSGGGEVVIDIEPSASPTASIDLVSDFRDYFTGLKEKLGSGTYNAEDLAAYTARARQVAESVDPESLSEEDKAATVAVTKEFEELVNASLSPDGEDASPEVRDALDAGQGIATKFEPKTPTPEPTPAEEPTPAPESPTPEPTPDDSPGPDAEPADIRELQ